MAGLFRAVERAWRLDADGNLYRVVDDGENDETKIVEKMDEENEDSERLHKVTNKRKSTCSFVPGNLFCKFVSTPNYLLLNQTNSHYQQLQSHHTFPSLSTPSSLSLTHTSETPPTPTHNP